MPLATELDRRLHAERIVRGTHRRRFHEASWRALPTGTFVLAGSGPALALDDALVPWTVRGYGHPQDRPGGGPVTVITPPSTVAALRAGYLPQIDAAAGVHRRGSTGTG